MKGNKRGISLIVLVITIIVMIILASAVVLSLKNSNIISQANKALQDSDLAQVKNLATLKWSEGYLDQKYTKQEDLEKYVKDELTKELGDIEKYEIIVTLEGVDVKLNGSNGGNGLGITEKWKENITAIVDTVPVPKGFVASPYDGEKTKAEGLVIYELNSDETQIPSTETHYESLRNRNQYVWVPVEDFSKFVRNLFGLKYEDRERYLTVSNELGKDFWEVALNTGNNTVLNAQDMDYITIDTLKEVQEMYASVKEYKGFYIARYEAGIYEQRMELGTNEYLPNLVYSRMSTWPYTYIYWQKSNDDNNGAVKLARDIYPNTDQNTTGVISTLIYGVQWDATLQWWIDSKAKDINGNIIDVNNSTSYGNYSNHEIKAGGLNEMSAYAVVEVLSEEAIVMGPYQLTSETSTKDKDTCWMLSTGALKAAKINNIYDMAGNVMEWTMEGENNGYRVMRGGLFIYGGAELSEDRGVYNLPLTSRGMSNGNNANPVIGFRAALYIKK